MTGLLLAGIGVRFLWRPSRYSICAAYPQQHVTNPPDSQKNFLVVDSKTETSAIEHAFDNFTTERKDIGILLINQHVRQGLTLGLWDADDPRDRSPSEFDIESIPTLLPFQLC